MKKLALLSLISLILPARADSCPPLDEIVPQIDGIHETLRAGSTKPLTFKTGLYSVHYGRTPKAVDKLLSGGFEGYKIHRLKQTSAGMCEYLVRDDNTPAKGSFVLKAQVRP